MHEYGKANWERLWEKLEQAGNVGIDQVINPSLYPRILDFLAQHPKSIVVDFGCGTNLMGVQLLFGYKESIPALEHDPSVDYARFNTLLYLGVEGSRELVDRSNRYLHDIGDPKNIAAVHCHIDHTLALFDERSIDLCVSRNFLMHLSLEDFSSHMAYVSRILKPQSYYMFTMLNPEYELIKAGRDLQNGERYEFRHGREGEYGTFYHYFKTSVFINDTVEKYFKVEKIEACIPISDKYRKTHERYYSAEPMAHTYILKVK
jgi:predicted SAM-dependent methyltransferase